MIYEYIMTPCTFEVGYKRTEIAAIEVLLIGNSPKRGYNGPYLTKEKPSEKFEPGETPRSHHTPWALARVCRLVWEETTPLLAAISLDDVHFAFHAFTPEDMSAWVERMGEERVRNMSMWSIDAVGHCVEIEHDSEGMPGQGDCSDDEDAW